MKNKTLTVGVLFSLFFLSFSLFPALAQTEVTVELQPNPDMSSSEMRNGVNVPVGFYYTQESTSYSDVPHFVDNPTPWNETNMVYDGDSVRAIFLESSPQSCNKFLNCPYLSTQGLPFDDTATYHIIIDLKVNDSIVAISSASDYVFFQLFDIDSTNTTQDFPFLAINETDVVTSATDPQFTNIQFGVSPLDASFNRFESDLDISGFAPDITFIDFEISRNGNWEGDFTITNFQIQQTIIIPPTELELTQDEVQAGLISVITLGIVLMIGFVVVGFVFSQLAGGGAETLVRFASIGALVIFIIMIILIIAFFGVV